MKTIFEVKVGSDKETATDTVLVRATSTGKAAQIALKWAQHTSRLWGRKRVLETTLLGTCIN